MTEPEFTSRRARRLAEAAQGLAMPPRTDAPTSGVDEPRPPTTMQHADLTPRDFTEPVSIVGGDATESGDSDNHGSESSDDVTLSHVRPDGSAHMVDVGGKPVTERRATAEAVVETRAEVVDAVITGSLPKGEAIGTARIAGIMAAKRTSDLIPLCHPLPLSSIEIDIVGDANRLVVTASAATSGVTGVEMEALTAASVTALTLFDMIKAVDKYAIITDVRVLAKHGGKSGAWNRE